MLLHYMGLILTLLFNSNATAFSINMSNVITVTILELIIYAAFNFRRTMNTSVYFGFTRQRLLFRLL
jgi:hypothetical protein